MSSKADDLAIDRILIDRFRSGDEAAFKEVVVRYRERIFARAYSLLRNREDAEEVTQDAFIRAHRGLANFRGDAAFSTWLFQIATNLAHNRYWYWWRRKRDVSISLDHQLTADGEGTLIDVMPAEDDSPAEEAVTHELVQRVAECMPKLAPKHREILTLRLVNNLSYEEISEQLGISVGTVKSRIARARDRLREKLGVEFA